MSILFTLIPITLALVGIACWAFFWAVGDGQFDDLDTPAWDVLRDDPSETDHDTP
jgi:cbb3-type cytochrome oxidase maturation protein